MAALPDITGAGAGLAVGAGFEGSVLPGGLAADGEIGEGFAEVVCAGFAGGVDGLTSAGLA